MFSQFNGKAFLALGCLRICECLSKNGRKFKPRIPVLAHAGGKAIENGVVVTLSAGILHIPCNNLPRQPYGVIVIGSWRARY